jgi:hypothetical protein
MSQLCKFPGGIFFQRLHNWLHLGANAASTLIKFDSLRVHSFNKNATIRWHFIFQVLSVLCSTEMKKGT